MHRMLFRSSLAFLMCLALLAGTVGSTLASSVPEMGQAARQTGPYAITNGAINVRGGPGVGFWILGYLNAAETVPVTAVSPDGAWWYVETRFGAGWVAGISVTAYNTGSVPQRDPGLIGTVIAGALHVRNGAGPNAPSIGRLARSEQVYIQAQSADGNWLQVRWAYGTGWVSKAYITTDSFAGVIPSEDIAVTSDLPYGMVTAAYLNVRSGPGQNYSSMGFVYGGEELSIVGRSADSSWYQVETRFGTGWVSAAFLLTRNEYGGTPITSGTIDDEAQITGPTAVINSGAAHVRSGPGPQYTSLGVLAGGAEGQIIGRNADWSWWLVSTSVGTGWIFASLVVVRGDSLGVPYVDSAAAVAVPDGQGGFNAGAAPAAQIALPEAVVTTGALHVRSGPNAAFASIGAVNVGEAMVIIGQSADRGWWLVESPFGQGWVSKAFVVVRGNAGAVPIVQ